MTPTYKELDNALIDSFSNEINLLIVTATKVEEMVLHQKLKPLPGYSDILYIAQSKFTYYLGIFGLYPTVHVGCDEMGAAGRGSSIVTTLAAIENWKPKAVLMIGIAFGADKKKQNIGDILVSERVLNYGPKKITKEGKEEFRGKEGPASSLLLNRFNNNKMFNHQIESKPVRIFPGLVLAGDILVDNDPVKRQLLALNPTAIGGEMEGAGIYAACDQKVNDWIMVKGICDFADGNKKKKKDLYQTLAMTSAVNLSEEVFSSPHGFKDIGLSPVGVGDDFSTFENAQKLSNEDIPAWQQNHINSLKKEVKDEN